MNIQAAEFFDKGDVDEGGVVDAAAASRVRTLLSVLPSSSDGAHTQWMAHKTVHGRSTNSSVKCERLTNTMDAVMKRHQGEVRMCEVPYLVPWEAGDGETPKDAEWVWLEGQ